MRVLVIGQGGREHAIVKGLALCPSVEELHAIPGNQGMQSEALCHNVDTKDHQAMVSFCQRKSIDLVVIGPEDPLIQGLSDALREANISAFGPSQAAAQLEGSKIFSKIFMQKGNIPTAEFEVVTSVSEVRDKCAGFSPPYVFKVDGLAAGKGVSICKDQSELIAAAEQVFEQRKFGTSGDRALLEQFQPGREMSVFVLTNAKDYALLPFAQDHKRLKDDNEGPNTGGMGAFAPMPISETLRQQLIDQIVEPTIKALADQNLDYRGVLYIGVMVTEEGPKVIEYNVRFGDPEAQVLIPLLDGDWAQTYKSVADGRVPQLAARKVSVGCVVMASPGYPDSAQKGIFIEGDPEFSTSASYFTHAGCKKDEAGKWMTNGGRVLGAIGIGDSIDSAIEIAYKQATHAGWAGLQMRNDIGKFRL